MFLEVLKTNKGVEMPMKKVLSPIDITLPYVQLKAHYSQLLFQPGFVFRTDSIWGEISGICEYLIHAMSKK